MYDMKALFEALMNGRYTVGEELGSGGMGSVHLIYDNRLRVFRALKVMSLPLAQTQKAASLRSRFQREAIAMANLRHPNIVMVIDSGEIRFEPEGFRAVAGRIQ